MGYYLLGCSTESKTNHNKKMKKRLVFAIVTIFADLHAQEPHELKMKQELERRIAFVLSMDYDILSSDIEVKTTLKPLTDENKNDLAYEKMRWDDMKKLYNEFIEKMEVQITIEEASIDTANLRSSLMNELPFLIERGDRIAILIGETHEQIDLAKKKARIDEEFQKLVEMQKSLASPGQTKYKIDTYDEPPDPLEKIVPEYPQFARASGIEGLIIVNAFVNEKGRVTETEIVKGMPKTGLDQAAVEAVKRVHFVPAKKNGEPIGVWITVPIQFRL